MERIIVINSITDRDLKFADKTNENMMYIILLPITKGVRHASINKKEFTKESGVRNSMNICSVLLTALILKILENVAAHTVRNATMNE